MDDFPSVTGRIHPNDRALAVHKYVWSGNGSEVARLFQVSPAAINKARKQTWWQELEDQELASLREQQAARMRRTVVKALDQLEDRIDNGDTVIDSEGQSRLQPVRAKDLAVCYGIVSQHMTRANAQPTLSVNIDLQQLAQQFAALAQGEQAQSPGQTVDGSLLKLPGRGKAEPV